MCIKDKQLFLEHDLPSGWNKGLSQCLQHDLNTIIRERNIAEFNVLQVKEKFGELRLYYSCTFAGGESNDPNDLIQEVIDKYAHVSSRTCVYCGKFPVPIINDGWIYPVCKACYEGHRYGNREYKDVVRQNDEFDPEYIQVRYNGQGKTSTTVSTQDIVERIRQWKENEKAGTSAEEKSENE